MITIPEMNFFAELTVWIPLLIIAMGALTATWVISEPLFTPVILFCTIAACIAVLVPNYLAYNKAQQDNIAYVQQELAKVDGYMVDTQTLKAFLYGKDQNVQQKTVYLRTENGQLTQVVLMKDNKQVGVFPIDS